MFLDQTPIEGPTIQDFQNTRTNSYLLYIVSTYEIYNLIKWPSDWKTFINQPWRQLLRRTDYLLSINMKNQTTNFLVWRTLGTSTQNNTLYTGVHALVVQRLSAAHEWQAVPMRDMNFNNEATVVAERRADMQRSVDLQSEAGEQAARNT